MKKLCERQLSKTNIVKMASLRLFVLTIVLFVSIVTNVEAGFHEFGCSIGNESWKNGKSNL